MISRLFNGSSAVVVDVRADDNRAGEESGVVFSDESGESSEISSKRRRRSSTIVADNEVTSSSRTTTVSARPSDSASATSGIERSNCSASDIRGRKRLGKVTTAAGSSADRTDTSIDERYLNAMANLVRAFLSNVMQTSDFVADEVDRMIRSIGRDPDISMLYETITSANQWRMAISAYKKPLYEHAMFGAIEYQLDRPLDRLMYALLVNQSLTVFYNAYKNWLTDERANAMLSYVSYLENLRRCLADAKFRAYETETMGTNDLDETSRAVLRATKFWMWGNCHVLLHQLVRAILLRVNANAVRECYVETNEAVSAWFERTVRFIERFRDTTPGDSIESLLEDDPTDSSEKIKPSLTATTKKRNVRSRRERA